MKPTFKTDFPIKLEPKSQTQEWEHKSVTMPESAELFVHAAGGWELVSVVRASRPDYVIAYFKRLKK